MGPVGAKMGLRFPKWDLKFHFGTRLYPGRLNAGRIFDAAKF